LHLFAGAGGGLLADTLLGHQCICAVEIDSYCQQVLSARQKDGCLPWFPIFADVKEFDGTPWRGLVDVVAGGFPCTDISAAGKGAGINGENSGLWREMARIIGQVRPNGVFVENSPMLTARGLGRVLGDLAEMGFDAEWGVISAADCGAPHERKRIWIMANAGSERIRSRTEYNDFEARKDEIGEEKREWIRLDCGTSGADVGDALHAERWAREQASGCCSSEFGKSGKCMANAEVCGCGQEGRLRREQSTKRLGRSSEVMGNANCTRSQGFGRLLERTRKRSPWEDGEIMVGHDESARLVEPGIPPLANGVAFRVDRIRASGNGQIPVVAATAFNLLSGMASKA